jgi:hypothetical protein
MPRPQTPVVSFLTRLNARKGCCLPSIPKCRLSLPSGGKIILCRPRLYIFRGSPMLSWGPIITACTLATPGSAPSVTRTHAGSLRTCRLSFDPVGLASTLHMVHRLGNFNEFHLLSIQKRHPLVSGLSWREECHVIQTKKKKQVVRGVDGRSGVLTHLYALLRLRFRGIHKYSLSPCNSHRTRTCTQIVPSFHPQPAEIVPSFQAVNSGFLRGIRLLPSRSALEPP